MKDILKIGPGNFIPAFSWAPVNSLWIKLPQPSRPAAPKWSLSPCAGPI